MKTFNHSATSLVCAQLTRLPKRALATWALVTTGFFTIPFGAAAQSVDRDPLNAPPAALTVTYGSAFTDYKSYQDPELISWKGANDVVREFGSMAAMGDRSAAKTPGNPDATSEVDRTNSLAQPTHDMSTMTPPVPAPALQKPITPARKPVEEKTMPGHDMSKMQPAPATESSAPRGKPVAPAPSMPGMSH